MKAARTLAETLRRIDGRGYKAYRQIKGEYRFDGYGLIVDHVQSDPFAIPSRIRVRVERKRSGFGQDTTQNRDRTVALGDYLIRAFYRNCNRFAQGKCGTGKSGLITIDKPGQQILARSAMVIDEKRVEARFFMGLPAEGRRIAGRDAERMFMMELPKIVAGSMFMHNHAPESLYRHIETAEDSGFLRTQLSRLGLVGFVADGASLPRASGIDDGPLAGRRSVLFQAPPSLAVEICLPNRGKIGGMGIPEGVTLIVGGGYHGKSTLLKALERGIYNHIPGDGREYVVSLQEAMKVRAADGRNVEKVNISPFINNLPFQEDTTSFCTANASGSTSQAANIIEALEAGATVLLLDEDTSATNFMIRDSRMQQLVAKSQEPITPFVDKVRQLYLQRGVSTILVMGGCGDYFTTADRVIQMSAYQPADVTQRARLIAQRTATERTLEGGEKFGAITRRIPEAASFKPHRFPGRLKIAAPRETEILFGRTTVDIQDLEQLVSISQTRALAHAIHFAMDFMDGKRTLAEVVKEVVARMESDGVEILTPYLIGDLAWFRGLELAGAINRMRSLSMRQRKT
jgi:predicted ABC-class ATPase